MRISIDELDYSDQHIYVYNNQPFTGLAYESLGDGIIIAEDSYVNGVLNGKSKEWYETGELKFEVDYRLGAVHGICKEWHKNGILKKEGYYEYGILLNEKEWNENGKLVKEYKIRENDPRQKTLELFRSIGKNKKS